MTKQARSKNSTKSQGTGDGGPPRYFIDLGSGGHGRSVTAVIGERRCRTHRRPELEDAAPQDLIDQITEHCKDTSDYLLPDTPIKEAIFRVLLSNGNEPLTPDEVGQILSDRWAMSASPRDLSHWVVQRLMEHSSNYFVTRVPEPEPPPEEAAETAEGQAEAEASGGETPGDGEAEEADA